MLIFYNSYIAFVSKHNETFQDFCNELHKNESEVNLKHVFVILRKHQLLSSLFLS